MLVAFLKQISYLKQITQTFFFANLNKQFGISNWKNILLKIRQINVNWNNEIVLNLIQEGNSE